MPLSARSTRARARLCTRWGRATAESSAAMSSEVEIDELPPAARAEGDDRQKDAHCRRVAHQKRAGIEDLETTGGALVYFDQGKRRGIRCQRPEHPARVAAHSRKIAEHCERVRQRMRHEE